MSLAAINTEPVRGKSRRRSARSIALAVGYGVIAYFLSMGPVSILLQKDVMSQGAFNTVYAPIFALADLSPTFWNLWHHYLDFFWILPGS